ncbi:hypothetical protein Cpir12675_003447 [Ceratocystis pirilliformis]|uniref:Jacalin-type lectin domain-containing protein n=1 Tax=Ceratocystis pirilliformis TaxID=259994 RepID=A0ABR3Z5A0_9PEZI
MLQLQLIGDNDFESHVGIYETNNYPPRTTALGGPSNGDGLDTLSKIPSSDFRRIKWNKCSNAEDGDCDAPKGFTFMRVCIGEGIYIDMYNLKFTLVRKDDSSADAPCGNTSETLMCELGDKAFSRGSPLLNLGANEFNYIGKAFSRRDGSLMSDYDPAQQWFNDVPTLAAKGNHPKAAIIAFSGGGRLDKVSVTLGDTTSLEHDGGGGDMKALTLEVDEYWTTIDLCQGEGEGKNRTFYAKATTAKIRPLEAGKMTEQCDTYSAPTNFQIVGSAGQAGEKMDQLTVVYGLQ